MNAISLTKEQWHTISRAVDGALEDISLYTSLNPRRAR